MVIKRYEVAFEIEFDKQTIYLEVEAEDKHEAYEKAEELIGDEIEDLPRPSYEYYYSHTTLVDEDDDE